MEQPGYRARLRDLVEEASAQLEADPDPRRSYEAAGDLLEDLRSLMHVVGQRRAAAVYRLWNEAGQPSAAQLAALLGCSRGRAHQLLTEARRTAGGSQ